MRSSFLRAEEGGVVEAATWSAVFPELSTSVVDIPKDSKAQTQRTCPREMAIWSGEFTTFGVRIAWAAAGGDGLMGLVGEFIPKGEFNDVYKNASSRYGIPAPAESNASTISWCP